MNPRCGVWMHSALDARLRSVWQAVLTVWSVRLVRLIVLGVVLGLAALSTYLRFRPQGAGPCTTDFSSFYYSAVALRHGTVPYGSFADAIRRGIDDPFTPTSCLTGALEFSYTPFFGLLVVPFTWLPFGAALALWDATILAFLGAAIYAFLRAACVSLSPYLVLMLTGIAALTSPLRFELYWAQADVLLTFFLCAALWAHTAGRTTTAGLLLSGACACEPALLALVTLLLWKREIKFAAVTLACSAALILAPFLWLGSKALGDLVVIWRLYWGAHAVIFTNNAPLGILLRWFTPNPYLKPLLDAPVLAVVIWLVVVLAVVVAAGVLIERRPLASDTRSLFDVGLALTGLLLISPWSENGQFTLLLLPFLAVWVYLGRAGWQTRPGRIVIWGFTGAFVLACVFGDPVQLALVARMDNGSALAYVYVLLGATYLYQLLAISAVIVYAQRTLPSFGRHPLPAEGHLQVAWAHESDVTRPGPAAEHANASEAATRHSGEPPRDQTRLRSQHVDDMHVNIE